METTMTEDEIEPEWHTQKFIAWLYQVCLIKKPQALHNGRKPTARRRR
jgi:hypothetical protein